MSNPNEERERARAREEGQRQALLSLGREHPAVVLMREMAMELAEAGRARAENPQMHLAPGGDRAVSYACGGAAYAQQLVDQIEAYLDPSTGPEDEQRLAELRTVRLGGAT